ncbi:putative quinol monooxygenase [Parasphingorhabdus sp. DH2-15]|uniref:putative quinol monooxygenase n=1 Tax=Parasphingorhabdus sp. DH2-15 TaxID=3444112 RepID=UPI003F682B8C
MIIVEGWIKFADGEIARVKTPAMQAVSETLKEDGCLHYCMAIDIDDPNLIRISERWRDEEALAAHFTAPHMVEFGKLLASVKRESADVRAYSAEEVRRLM